MALDLYVTHMLTNFMIPDWKSPCISYLLKLLILLTLALACHLFRTYRILSCSFFLMILSRWISTDFLVSLIFLDNRSRYLSSKSFCHVWNAWTTLLSILTFPSINYATLIKACSLSSNKCEVSTLVTFLFTFNKESANLVPIFSSKALRCPYSLSLIKGSDFILLELEAVKKLRAKYSTKDLAFVSCDLLCSKSYWWS